LKNEQPVWQILCAAVREAIAKSSSIPTIDFDVDGSIDIPVFNAPSSTFKAPSVQVNSDYNPFKPDTSYQQPSFDWSKLYKGFEEDRAAAFADESIEAIYPENQELSSGLTSEPAPDTLFPEVSSLCYQYKGRYIITSLKSGLLIIDQHRAHVRVLFDQYLTNIRNQQGVSQQLLFPEIVTFTPAEATLVPSLLEDLRYIGFDLSNLGNNSYAINGLPSGVENLDPVALVKDAVSRAIDTGCQVHEEICDALALSLAKAAAIRPGQSLSSEEMDNLIASLFSSSSSSYTPDGKVILSKLTDDELDKRFKNTIMHAINLHPILPVRAEASERSEQVTQLLFGEQFLTGDQKEGLYNLQSGGWIYRMGGQPDDRFYRSVNLAAIGCSA
jgi:DNA mismatch repair protein MutL